MPTRLRPGADRRLLLVVAAFGVSVVATRAFLGATGYPKIGGGEFHVAHVLIGGALRLAASVISLTVLALVALYVNQFAAIGGVVVQAVLVVAALEHRQSMGTVDPAEEAAAPSF